MTQPEHARLEKLRALLASRNADAIWVTRPANVRYLSGFRTPEDGMVLVTKNEAVLVTDSRYRVQAAQESVIEVVTPTPTTGQNRLEAQLLFAKKIVANTRVLFEAEHLTVDAHARLQRFWEGTTLTASTGLVAGLRRRKDTAELTLMQQAAHITDDTLADVLPMLRPGVTELEVALALEQGFKRRGAQGVAFEIIVASGERSAMPHGVASNRVIGEGELVTVDCGAKYLGYCADLTRTYAVGEVGAQMREVYNVVQAAQAAALGAIRPGMQAKDLDGAARKIIEDAGFGEQFDHGLGHGVGLEIHESPNVGRASGDVLQVGDVVTIEPGVYLDGVGGVRIEDLVVVTESGCTLLSHAPKVAV